MYKAIKKIGGYQIGEEVPADKAEIWLKMYSVPQVKKVNGNSEKPEGNLVTNEMLDEPEPSKKESSKNVMLDDYLGRNTNVVKKNIEDDDLSKEQLTNLLELEKSGKKRKVVIEAIKRKLKK